MKLLALDTATELCSAALWLDGELRGREELAPRAHGALILVMIAGLLEEAALDLASLDAIAFGRGPGAFTGLRLAAAVAQGLAVGAQLPLIPVGLRAVAAQALAGEDAPRCALICQDARMGEVYWGCYERRERSLEPVAVERVTAPAAVVLPANWLAGLGVGQGIDLDIGRDVGPDAGRNTDPDAGRNIGQNADRNAGGICAAGSGFAAYAQLSTMFSALVTTIRPDLYPRAREIAELAVEDGLACAVSPEEALPVYLRDRVASSP